METEAFNKLRSKCWDNSLHSFGHGYIFDKRAQRYGRYVNWLKVFGLLVPAIIGATAIGYGYNNVILKDAIILAIPITIVQFIFSVLAVIYKWDDELSYSFEASQAYNNFWDKFKKLGEIPPKEYGELERRYDLLNVEVISRNQQDTKHNIKEWELRKGMRAALREFQRNCVGCNEIPQSMESKNCNVCGNFKYTLFKS
jgi:mobilome CxxCx(11)CxxC protein